MSSAELKEELAYWANPAAEFIDFVAFAKEIISKTSKIKTAEWYKSSLRALVSFMKRDRIDVKDIDGRVLEAFGKTLAEKKIIIEKKMRNYILYCTNDCV